MTEMSPNVIVCEYLCGCFRGVHWNFNQAFKVYFVSYVGQ